MRGGGSMAGGRLATRFNDGGSDVAPMRVAPPCRRVAFILQMRIIRNKDLQHHLRWQIACERDIVRFRVFLFRDATPRSTAHTRRPMQLATWDVNSLNVRLPHVLDWLSANPVDALCLDRKSTRLNSSHIPLSRMPSSA